ncbi:protein 108-like isoform X1 [Coffea arabica]|uniref:Protein 108-like isoform X1 n=1 Tax=Coffea arabica TaxID=13443 RepID=A0A6P6VF74_COFAR
MATVKKSVASFGSSPAMLALLFLALVLQNHVVKSQEPSCPTTLANLNVCVPFLVPGSGPADNPPSAECCNAVQAVKEDCICNTLQIASRLPTRCNLPVLNCSAAN